jgi:hypothetical protein
VVTTETCVVPVNVVSGDGQAASGGDVGRLAATFA